jgi:hypothetical protein
MSNTPSYLDRLPIGVWEFGGGNPPPLPPVPGRTPVPGANTPQITKDGYGNWVTVLPEVLGGIAGIANVFWGQPETNNYITQGGITGEEGGTDMTIVIILVVAVAILYFLLKK